MAEIESEVIKATYQHTLYEKQDKSFCVYVYRDYKTGKVFNALGSGLCNEPKILIELTGCWVYDKKTGKKQLNVLYYDIPKQETKDGIIAFLGSLKCGIGRKKAELIYTRFGEETWDVIDRDLEKLSEIKGITARNIESMKKSLKQNMQQRKIIVLFTKAKINISSYQANAIITRFGRDVSEMLLQNPYCICGVVDGMTFEKCDALADYIGIPENSPYRLKAYVFKLLQSYSVSGNVCMPKDMLLQGMMNGLNCDRESCVDAIKEVWAEGKIKCTNNMIYTTRHYNDECSIAQNVSRIIKSAFDPITDIDPLIDTYEENEGSGFRLADNQREAIREAFRSPFSIITGGPGTGKTTVLKAILAVHRLIYGDSSQPVLLAPTGKAARRMSDATGYAAATIHSAVGYRNEEECEDPNVSIEGNLVIVDEVSMMDQLICSVLLRKIESNVRLIFCGDPDQLPSVGCGNILWDMINSSSIPVTKLNVIYRQAENNPIVENASRIHEGRTDLVYTDTFRFCECRTEEETFNNTCSFFLRCVKAYGLDNVLLLNPQRNHTSVSVSQFNLVLQDKLNPPRPGEPEITVGKTTYRKRDKVMQLKNCEAAKNGDTGYILDIRSREDPNDSGHTITEAVIEFNGDGMMHTYSTDDMRNIDLAYCSTVHKAQGEEYQNIVIVISLQHRAMLKRNMIYTGLTRSRQNVAIFGNLEAIKMCIQDDNYKRRDTLLSQRISSLCR